VFIFPLLLDGIHAIAIFSNVGCVALGPGSWETAEVLKARYQTGVSSEINPLSGKIPGDETSTV
jgi:hypothetical protein